MKSVPLRLAITLLFALGCSADVPEFPATVPVTGTVMQGGKPVEGATVIFNPPQLATGPSSEASYPATGVTDAEGKFTLSTYFSPAAAEDGAVPGQYNVTVTKFPPAQNDPNAAHDAPAAAKPVNLLPKQYAAPATTTIRTNVEAGKPLDLPIDLK